MSYLVLHMDKFKRESLRGIQSHNRRDESAVSSKNLMNSRHKTQGRRRSSFA